MIGPFDGVGMTSPRTRERLIRRLEEEGIRSPRVLEALRAVPRHLFVEEALASRSYEDTALPIGQGQTISQPYVVARMTELLLDRSVQRVLEVGTGSGYQAAVLSQLVPEVYSLERIESLLVQAGARLRQLGIDNVRLVHGDGNAGLPEYAPYDGILVTAAPEGVPKALIQQLRIGGRLVIPVGGRNGQSLLRITRMMNDTVTEVFDAVIFVPMLDGVR